MEKCRNYHGTKLKIGVGRIPKVKVETVDDNKEVKPFVPIMTDAEPSQIPEQDAVNAIVNTIPGLDHLHDIFVNMEVKLNKEEKELYRNGNTIGQAHKNPVLNTLMYEVKFNDGTSCVYVANIITENMWRSVNNEGYHEDLLHAILDHQFSKNAKKDGYIHNRHGRRRLRKTTRGVQLLVAICDGIDPPNDERKIVKQWCDLKDLKELHPIEVAEYAVTHKIDGMPVFAWWVPYTLKKRDRIISAVKARITRTTHKYNIEVPRTIQHAIEIDTKNNNRYWQDAIKKEMTNVGVAFDILPPGERPKPGYTKASGHIAFDVKMDFTWKARWMKDGHKTADPLVLNYTGVVSCDTVRIAFTYAALNDLNVCAADVRNTYIQALSSNKHYIICGPEFSENEGRTAIIIRDLYGGKSAGRDYWLHLCSCMQFLGFAPCKADPNLWIRPAKRKENLDYYEYVLLYIDDCLPIGVDPESIVRHKIGKYFQLKEESIGEPTIYLGGTCSQVEVNGICCWLFSLSQYVKAACKNVRRYLEKLNHGVDPNDQKYFLPNQANAPFQNNYQPEIDISEQLSPEFAAYHQSLIGIFILDGRTWLCRYHN